MAIDTQFINDDRGQDEVVANQRTRAYVAGNPVAASVGGAGSFGTLWMTGTGVATNFTTGSQTLTAAQLGGGIIVGSPSAAATYTLDTATNILNYMQNNSAGIQIGDILQCLLTNAGSGTGVITVSPGTGGGFDTGQNNNLQLPINTSRVLNIRITALGASPAYIVYG